MRLICGLAVVVTSCATLAPRATFDCATQAAVVDVLNHDVELSVTLVPPRIQGSGDLRLKARAPTKIIVLDAHGLAVDEVSFEGARVELRTAPNRVCVQLPRAISAAEEVTLSLRWAASTTAETPSISNTYAWAGYDTPAWLPTVQDPAQRATLTLRLTAPQSLAVAASGRRVTVHASANHTHTHTFVVEQRVPPFLFAFAVGEFDEAHLEAQHVTLTALAPKGATPSDALSTTAAALRFLTERTGVAYPLAQYQQVFVEGDAAQESAGLAVVSAHSLDDLKADATDDWVFTHELAHQWFGVLIPCADFSDFWLNEGFATFFVAAFKEHRFGRPAYEQELAAWRARSAKVHAQGRDAPVSLSSPMAPHPHLAESELQPRGVTYFRGALVLNLLRETLGDEAFWAGIRRYATDRAGKSATSEDLRRAFEQASGKDLREFFATWVYASAPTL